jgi:RNA polymerase-associated protein CTR9
LVPELQAESLFHRARVLHTKGVTEEAIKFYARATEIYPELTPARWGWAQCQIALGMYAEAMKNLIIVTTQNPQAMEAFAILGLLQIVMQLPSSTAHSTTTNTDATNAPESANSNSANDRKQALANLKKATELDPNNVEWVLLQALVYQMNKAEYSLALDRYQKAVEMMELQNSLTTSNEHAPAVIPPDIYTNIGVIHQELGQYDEALRMYEMALKGLGDATSDSFDKIEDNIGDLVIIREESNKLFWTFVDSGLKVARPVLGATDKLLVTNEPEREIISMIQVGDHIRIGKIHSFTTEIVEITSQEATTMIRIKDLFTPPPASHDNEYLAVFVKRPTSLLRHPVAITIAFNLARLHEDAGRPVAAVELHKAILRKHPSYVNCYLRLACIACDNGLLDECSEWLKGAVKVAPSHPEVLTLVGNLHLSLSDWAPAQKLFDKLLSLRNPTVEAYSLLSLGNIYFSSLYSSPERYEKNLMHAADYYRKVLSKDKSNYFAANGIGTILAEKGDLFRAKEIFNRVREVCGDAIPDTLLNLGHIYLAQKKHPEALQMYNNYKSRAFSKGIASNKEHAAVLLYIAFAYFDWARQTEMFNNAKAAPADERYAKCIEHIELALKLQKDNHILKYNWCMAKLQAANCILQKLTRNIPRTAQEVADALQGLEDSLPVVQQLMNWKNAGKKVIISTATLAGFISQCQDNIEMTKKHLNEEVKREAELEERREIQRLEAKQLQLEREKELLARREAEEKARQEQEMKVSFENATFFLCYAFPFFKSCFFVPSHHITFTGQSEDGKSR